MPGALFKFLPLLLATIGSLAAPISLKHRQAAPAPKLVVAHVIVGNTASYSVDTWQSDIKLAQQNGIDGFALNIGSTAPFTDAQVKNA
jgi:glucan endo-1,3-alpha-glucosidase